jgi:hypothetical protein
MHVDGLVDAFVRIDRMMEDRRFAFVLGAGASRSSGIKTGGELVREWLEILYRRDPAALSTKAGSPGLEVRVEFYAYAHVAEQYPNALADLKRRLLELGARAPHADLSPNLERAIRDRHPQALWLPRLAKVIEGKAEPESLDGWEAWRQASWLGNARGASGAEREDVET